MDEIKIEKIRFSLEGKTRLTRVYDFDIDYVENVDAFGKEKDIYRIWFKSGTGKLSARTTSFSFLGNAEMKFINRRLNITSRIIMLEADFVERCRDKEFENKATKVNVYCFSQKEYNDLLAEEVYDSL